MESESHGRELRCDILIAGGGLGACAAALAAAQAGRTVILTEPTDWIGGQLTQQAVPPDENRWVETIGGTARYRRLRTGIRNFYRRWFPLTKAAQANEFLNPGGGWVSRLCHEPRVALAVLEAMLATFCSTRKVRILRCYRPISADVSGDTVRALQLENAQSGSTVTIVADFFLDATEFGDLLPLADCEYVTGFESQQQHNEPHAPSETQPENIQAVTWCFAMDMVDGTCVIDKPDNYDWWCAYEPQLNPPWPGRMFQFTYSSPKTLEPRELQLEPRRSSAGKLSLWDYRKIQDPSIYQPDFLPESPCPGITIVNWPQTDYVEGSLFDGTDTDIHWKGAKEQALCFFYWLQTEAPRLDHGTGFPGLRLRPDITGTEDGFAKYPYVRESRRILAELTVTECHVGVQARPEATAAERFNDSVGIGHYGLDLHPSTGKDNYIDIASYPFQVPLGALIPARMQNLLPACKNIGTTHITNGCYRLHPVEWNIGEVAGLLADTCLRLRLPPKAIRESTSHLADFQHRLVQEGISLEWPEETA